VTDWRNPDAYMGQDRTARRHAIGVFDSGVGGLTVVRALRAVLPGEDITYLGDTARVPYGSKSPRTVERYSLTCQLVAASPVPVIGAVEPGARTALAVTENKHVGVIGTLATIRSSAYAKTIHALDPDVKVSALACPLFVPLAEEGWTTDEIAKLAARKYLVQLFAQDPQIDTLVLGCTHYPLLRDVISEVAVELAHHPVHVVDSATAMAEAAREALGSGPNRRTEAGRLDCFATDTSRLDEVAPRFLGEPLTGFELVDL
jgi:glutamate racemase